METGVEWMYCEIYERKILNISYFKSTSGHESISQRVEREQQQMLVITTKCSYAFFISVIRVHQKVLKKGIQSRWNPQKKSFRQNFNIAKVVIHYESAIKWNFWDKIWNSTTNICDMMTTLRWLCNTETWCRKWKFKVRLLRRKFFEFLSVSWVIIKNFMILFHLFFPPNLSSSYIVCT